MFTAYERSAFGELAGGFWIPLLLLLVFRDRNPKATARIWRRAFDGSAALLALVIAGAWLSNAPLGVMASYLLAAVALTVALLERSWAPILRATVAVMHRTRPLRRLSCSRCRRAATGCRSARRPTTRASPLKTAFSSAATPDPNLELHDVELWRVSGIAVIMIGLDARLHLDRVATRHVFAGASWWIPLALIPVIVLFLQFPFSLPIWNILPKLRFLQFPWRWLVVLEAPIGIFFAAALWPTRRWLRIAAVAAACSAIFLSHHRGHGARLPPVLRRRRQGRPACSAHIAAGRASKAPTSTHLRAPTTR